MNRLIGQFAVNEMAKTEDGRQELRAIRDQTIRLRDKEDAGYRQKLAELNEAIRLVSVAIGEVEA